MRQPFEPKYSIYRGVLTLTFYSFMDLKPAKFWVTILKNFSMLPICCTKKMSESNLSHRKKNFNLPPNIEKKCDEMMTAAAENEWICITIKSKLWLKELDPAHIAQKHSSWKVNAGIVENYTIKNWQSICPEIATPSLKALKAGAALLNIGGLGNTSKSSFIQILGLGFIGNKNWQKKLQKKKLASSQNGQKRSFFDHFCESSNLAAYQVSGQLFRTPCSWSFLHQWTHLLRKDTSAQKLISHYCIFS